MSTSSARSLVRLPLSVFEDLGENPHGAEPVEDRKRADQLKTVLCERVADENGLKAPTVGNFARLTPLEVLQLLDPLLLYGKDNVCD